MSDAKWKPTRRTPGDIGPPNGTLTIGLLTSVGATLDAFFVEIVRNWETLGVRVVTAAGDASRSFTHQSVIRGVTRNPHAVNVKAIAGLRCWITHEQIDVVITNTATASMLVRLANVNARVVYFCHGLHWNGSRMRDLPFRALEQKLLGRTDGIICINGHDESWFTEKAPDVPRLRLRNGVGLDTTRFTRQPLNTWNGTDPVRLVWCGEFIPRKNPKAAIDLARTLRSKGVSVHLDMLGEGPLASALELPTEPGVEMVLVGRTDPVPYFRTAHALVQTSRWEGLPRVALEAVAMGRPTVGFDVKGVQDIPGAYLAPEDDIGLLAAQTIKAVTAGPRALPTSQDLSYERAADAVLGFARSIARGPRA